MQKAYEVMTRALAICTPETSVSLVAAAMRDRDIGNILVVEDGKLCGIVTDRDLALKALSGADDPLTTPVSKFMSKRLVTGQTDWSLAQVAEVMADNQIRRLPILQEGRLVGIISLGDVALHAEQKEVVHHSLQAISAPAEISALGRAKPAGAWLGFSFAALATLLLAWFTWGQSGRARLQQISKSEFYHQAQHAAKQALNSAEEVASSQMVNTLSQKMVKSELFRAARQVANSTYHKVGAAFSA